MLNVEFAIAGLEVDVYAGAEYFMDIRVLKDLESGSLVTLGRSRSVLLEFPGTHIPKYSDKIIEILTGSGYTPVLAHPERCSDIVRNTDILGTFTEKGCKVQVDSRSFTGENGKSVMSAASRFLKKQMIDYIAFDIHRVFSLKKHIGILKKYIENIGGESLVTFLDAEEEFTKSSDLELRK